MLPVCDPAVLAASMLITNSNEIHVWIAEFDSLFEHSADDGDFLSNTERIKSRRFRFENDRVRYVAGRSFLRKTLANYLGIAPKSIQLGNGASGKPILDQVIHESSIKFNVSHSREVIVVAVSERSDLGIDVEFIDENFPALRVSQVLSPDFAVSGLTTLREFFTQWTRMEAYFKGLGVGLSGLARRVAPDESCRPYPTDIDTGITYIQGWSIRSFSVGNDYIGALANLGEPSHLRFFEVYRSLGQPVIKQQSCVE